jgi:hypothetical protein
MQQILTMLDGSLPWSLHEWYMGNFWCPYVGYSDILNKSYTYTLYMGNDIPGEHSFSFEY